MQQVEIVGFKRTSYGTSCAKRLRKTGHVPAVLHSSGTPVHLHVPLWLLEKLVYTPKVYFILLNLEGTVYRCILHDMQFHPVSELILHADFLQLADDKKVKMNVPIVLKGDSPGIAQGGQLVEKLRKTTVVAYPKDMPEHVEVDISSLELGKSLKVRDLVPGDYQILNAPSVPVVLVEVPRALRSKAAGEAVAAKSQ